MVISGNKTLINFSKYKDTTFFVLIIKYIRLYSCINSALVYLHTSFAKLNTYRYDYDEKNTNYFFKQGDL